jgi:hypothetical protein
MLMKLARMVGALVGTPVEDGYILRWRGRVFLRLPQSILSGATAAPLPEESPLQGDEFFETKQEATLSIMDEDTHGFIVLTLKKNGAAGDIAIHGHMPKEASPALQATLVRMLVETQRLHEPRAA